jgi:hypothetical protein
MKITGTVEFGYEYEEFKMNNYNDDPKEDPRPDDGDDTVEPGKAEEDEEIKRS